MDERPPGMGRVMLAAARGGWLGAAWAVLPSWRALTWSWLSRAVLLVALVIVGASTCIEFGIRLKETYEHEVQAQKSWNTEASNCELVQRSGRTQTLNEVERCAIATKKANQTAVWRTLYSVAPHLPSGRTAGESVAALVRDAWSAIGVLFENNRVLMAIIVLLGASSLGNPLVTSCRRSLRDMIDDRIVDDERRRAKMRPRQEEDLK
jgi:hypothetical protein